MTRAAFHPTVVSGRYPARTSLSAASRWAKNSFRFRDPFSNIELKFVESVESVSAEISAPRPVDQVSSNQDSQAYNFKSPKWSLINFSTPACSIYEGFVNLIFNFAVISMLAAFGSVPKYWLSSISMPSMKTLGRAPPKAVEPSTLKLMLPIFIHPHRDRRQCRRQNRAIH